MSNIFKYCLSIVFFISLPTPARALWVSEIGYNPAGTDTGHEWVELYNETDQTIDVGALRLSVNDGEPAAIVINAEAGGQGSLSLPAKQTIVVAANAKLFLADHPGYAGAVADSAMSLLNSLSEGQNQIILKIVDTSEAAVAVAGYVPLVPSADGYTQELLGSNWQKSAQIGGSPGVYLESVQSDPSPSPTVSSGSVRLSEIVSNLVGSDTGAETVELENYSDTVAVIGGWKIVDAQGNTFAVPANSVVPPRGYLTVTISGSMLNNTDEVVSLQNESGQVVDTVMLSGAAKEGWSYARVGDGWFWTSSVTPSSANVIASAISPTLTSPKSTSSPKTTASAKITPTPKTASATKSPSPKATKAKSSASPKPTKLSVSIPPKSASPTAKKGTATSSPTVKGASVAAQGRTPLIILAGVLSVILIASIIIYRFKLIELYTKFRERWKKDLIT
jgi:hypothetical protein